MLIQTSLVDGCTDRLINLLSHGSVEGKVYQL
jgi:hypothetical protein